MGICAVNIISDFSKVPQPATRWESTSHGHAPSNLQPIATDGTSSTTSELLKKLFSPGAGTDDIESTGVPKKTIQMSGTSLGNNSSHQGQSSYSFIEIPNAPWKKYM